MSLSTKKIQYFTTAIPVGFSVTLPVAPPTAHCLLVDCATPLPATAWTAVGGFLHDKGRPFYQIKFLPWQYPVTTAEISDLPAYTRCPRFLVLFRRVRFPNNNFPRWFSSCLLRKRLIKEVGISYAGWKDINKPFQGD